MSNQQYEALYKGKRHYDKNGKPLGGIKVMVDDSYMVEVEGGEYKICNDAYNSDEVLSFNGKTNKEILDYIHGNFSCKFEQSKAKSGDFILCRLVVNDEKKKKYSGTVRQILDAMQSEHSCRVSFGDKSMKKGGEISPEEIEERWNKKKEHIEKLSEAIRSLRNNLTRDIKGDDEKERLTALAISVIDKTAERVGNGDSEQNGHFGVTGFQKKHIKVVGNTVYLNYVGKSGVKHEKQFSDELISAALKNAMNESSCNFVFCTKDGFRIKPDKINRYLSEYGITAKDIRGYSANRWIVDRLNNIEEKDIPETEAKRKRKFNKILKSVAAKVGHGSGTLKKHYMIPELETTFIQGGEILNLSSFYSKGGSITDEKKLIEKDSKYFNTIIDYVYYNNPDEEDELQPTDAPYWIIEGSKKYLQKKKINKIYRGIGEGNYNEGVGYSWTYDKKVTKNFGDKILEIDLPEKFVSIEYVFDLIQKNKYYPKGATADLKEWIDDFDGGEREVIVVDEKLSKGGYVRLSKTPAPKSERIYGSSKNAPKSAASKDSGKNIELSSSIVSSILNKLKEHNSIHKDKRVTLGVAKAVVRRGMGAYSATHRPTIKGGQPNSRVAWGLARLNAFLIKAATGKSKSGRYSQDNDLLDELNIPHEKYENGGNFKRQVVGNIIYSKNQGFLFLQRADDCEKNSGKWHILSGGVEDGESLEVAAKREFVEEVGYNGEIEIEKLQTIDFKDYEFTYFLIMPKKPFNPKLDFENKDYKWVYSIDEMLNTDLIPELKEYLISFNKGFNKIYKEGGSVDKNCIDFIKKTEAILKNGYYHRFGSFCFITYNSGNQKDLNVYQTVNLVLSKRLSELLEIDEESAKNLISNYCDSARRFDTLDIIKELKGCNIVIADRDKIVCANNMQNDKGGEIENLISQGVIDLKFYETTPEHAKGYGIKAIKPIFVQNLCVSEKHRLKGIGNKVLKYIESYAQNNGNDVIFGYLADNAVFSKDSRQSYFCDADMVKNWLQSKGYAINDDNNDFHKAIKDGTNTTLGANNPDIRFENGGNVLLAPNGKPSNLTSEQYKLVRTKAFKDWFGDWEDDPANASKVVDENGEPLVVYHTTDNEFNTFNERFAFFSKEPINAFGERIIKSFLNLKKPYTLSDADSWQNINISKKDEKWNELYDYLKEIDDVFVIEDVCNWAKLNGYDGVIAKNIGETEDASFVTDDYIAFYPNQIKLADGTNTTFDGSNPDIRFDNGGLIDFSEKEIRKYAENILKDFDYVYSGYSDTNGHSMYFKIDDVKIRFSDHSVTNIYRINNEVLFNLWDGKKIGTPYGDFAINQSILKLKYALGDKSIIYHKRPMMMPSGKMVNAFGYSDNSDIHFDNGGSVLLAPNGKPSNLTPEQYKLVRTPEFKAWFGDWENDPKNASKVVDSNGEPKVMWHGSNAMSEINIFKSNKGHDYSFFSDDKNESSRYVIDFDQTEVAKKIDKRNHTERTIKRDLYYKSKIKPFFIKSIKPFDYNNLSETDKSYTHEFLNKNKDELYAVIKEFASNTGMSINVYLEQNDIDVNITESELLKYFLSTSSDDWWILETKAFQEYIKNNNFDSFVTKESGAWNIAVYNPNQIKLADGTNTTFDGGNLDIRYDVGGEITLLKNKTKAPYFDKMYGQDVEPTGYYAIKKETDIFDSNPNYETKKIRFENPLYIEVDADTLISWKNDLSKKFKAKGKKLTEKLLNEGYDIIITRYSNGDTGEIIVLDTDILKMNQGGKLSEENHAIYQKWKKLVNMTAAELEKFYNSEEGKDAGLKPKEAKDLGIHYGRESARWIIKMKKTPITEWTPEMWEWAKRQINFNTRMLGNKGGLYDEKGKKTRKHTSLLIWGHNPEKKEEGGIIYSVEEMIMSLNKSPFLKVSQMPNGKISFSEIENGTDAIVEFIDSEDLKSRYLLYSF